MCKPSEDIKEENKGNKNKLGFISPWSNWKPVLLLTPPIISIGNRYYYSKEEYNRLELGKDINSDLDKS